MKHFAKAEINIFYLSAILRENARVIFLIVYQVYWGFMIAYGATIDNKSNLIKVPQLIKAINAVRSKPRWATDIIQLVRCD